MYTNVFYNQRLKISTHYFSSNWSSVPTFAFFSLQACFNCTFFGGFISKKDKASSISLGSVLVKRQSSVEKSILHDLPNYADLSYLSCRTKEPSRRCPQLAILSVLKPGCADMSGGRSFRNNNRALGESGPTSIASSLQLIFSPVDLSLYNPDA